MKLDSSIIEVFILESKDLISKMEDALLRIEKGEDATELIKNVFRVVHTLKGAAAMFDFVELTNFCHVLENHLVKYRSKIVKFDLSIINILLQAVDCLDLLVKESVIGKITSESITKKNNIIEKLENYNNTIVLSSSENLANQNSNFVHQPEIEHSLEIIKNFIKVDVTKLDIIINLIGEIIIMQAHLSNQIKENHTLTSKCIDTIEKIANLIDVLRNLSLKIRMLPIKESFNKFNRVVRDIATQENKQIQLYIEGADTELDKSIIEKINIPLLHLIRNACDHGIDFPAERIKLSKPSCGTVTLCAHQENSEVIIKVHDDGRGLDLAKIKLQAIHMGLIKSEEEISDEEVLNFIFRAGFSTAEQISKISGRGLGMDIVKREVEKLHGSVSVNSKTMEGTTVSIRLPLTLAIIDGLLVNINDFACVIPIWNVSECIQITRQEYQSTLNNNYMQFRNKILPAIILSRLLGIEVAHQQDIAIIIQHADYKISIIVDALVGWIQAVIKPMPEMFNNLHWINGATVLGNGKVAVILDIPQLIPGVLEEYKKSIKVNS